MKLLLDTHALLWWLFDDAQMSRTARGVIQDPANDVFVSAASAWEIATKFRLGKLASASVLVQDMAGCFSAAGFRELLITVKHAQRAGSFPQAHRDPFDRMLAAQALLEDLSLVTRDPTLDQFGAKVVW